MESLESAEQFVLVSHVKTGAIIPHKKGFLAIQLGGAKFNAGDTFFPSEFEKELLSLRSHQLSQVERRGLDLLLIVLAVTGN